MTKQGSRKILLLILPLLLWYSFFALSKDCFWNRPYYQRPPDSVGSGGYSHSCGFPFEYSYYYIHEWNYLLSYNNLDLAVKALVKTMGESLPSLGILILDVTFALAPICLWFYSFRKLHSVSKNQGVD